MAKISFQSIIKNPAIVQSRQNQKRESIMANITFKGNPITTFGELPEINAMSLLRMAARFTDKGVIDAKFLDESMIKVCPVH